MTLDVMLVVLLSALLHAGWNALVRAAADKFLSTLVVVLGAGLLALPLLPWLALPAPASWPYLLASALIHVVYFTLVAWSYRHADLSLAYPVMRGTAPVLTALAAALLLGEMPAAGGWAGIALICLGVLALAGAAWRVAPRPGAALLPALANAVVIAAYTLIDGQGARLSGQAAGYTGWLFLLTAVLLLGLAWGWRGHRVLQQARALWRPGLLGGAGTLTAYGLVLWAMAQAPMALVAALRETSIVFAALIGALLLHERLHRSRLIALALICAGAVAIKLS